MRVKLHTILIPSRNHTIKDYYIRLWVITFRDGGRWGGGIELEELQLRNGVCPPPTPEEEYTGQEPHLRNHTTLPEPLRLLVMKDPVPV